MGRWMQWWSWRLACPATRSGSNCGDVMWLTIGGGTTDSSSLKLLPRSSFPPLQGVLGFSNCWRKQVPCSSVRLLPMSDFAPLWGMVSSSDCWRDQVPCIVAQVHSSAMVAAGERAMVSPPTWWVDCWVDWWALMGKLNWFISFPLPHF